MSKPTVRTLVSNTYPGLVTLLDRVLAPAAVALPSVGNKDRIAVLMLVPLIPAYEDAPGTYALSLMLFEEDGSLANVSHSGRSYTGPDFLAALEPVVEG